MKLSKIISLVKSNLNQFVALTSDPLVDKKIESLIVNHRAITIEQRYALDRRIHPDWLQPYTPTFDPGLQYDDEFIVFEMFPTIDLDGRHDGIIYVGSPECQKQFRRCNTRGEWANINNIPRLNGRVVKFIVEDGLLKIKKLRDITVTKVDTECIFSNPRRITSFNADVDNYPIDEGGVPIIVESIYKEYSHPTLVAGSAEQRKEDKVL